MRVAEDDSTRGDRFSALSRTSKQACARTRGTRVPKRVIGQLPVARVQETASPGDSRFDSLYRAVRSRHPVYKG